MEIAFAVVNGTATSYSYGSYNKLLSAGSTTYTYDNNGNTIAKMSGSNSWGYTFDNENRLKQVKVNSQLVFQGMYDGDGRRIETIAGDTTVYYYSAGSWDPSYVKDLTSGVVTDLVFAGGFRVGKVQGGVNSYYHLDLLGSVRLVTQAPNLQTFTAKYLPYGNLYATSGAENFQYTGKQLDVSTGLYYYGYRYLDGQSGRFTTRDLGRPTYENPQTLNQYSYALNNPNRYVDPDGRGCTAVGAILGVINVAIDFFVGGIIGSLAGLPNEDPKFGGILGCPTPTSRTYTVSSETTVTSGGTVVGYYGGTYTVTTTNTGISNGLGGTIITTVELRSLSYNISITREGKTTVIDMIRESHVGNGPTQYSEHILLLEGGRWAGSGWI